MSLFKREMPYSTDEIKAQESSYNALEKERERCLQQIALNRKDTETMNLEGTMTVLVGNLHTTQLTIAHMLQANKKWMERHNG